MKHRRAKVFINETSLKCISFANQFPLLQGKGRRTKKSAIRVEKDMELGPSATTN
jgi:hypothetical protein